MRIAFYTLGCKVNQYETEAMRECFSERGHDIVSENGEFDVIVINSCTVTAESDRKTRQTVRHFRREHPDAVIVLTGCMAQAFPDDAKALADADIIAGNTDHRRIAELCEEFLQNGERIFEIGEHKKGESFNTPAIGKFADRTRAYMKIEDGCERYCTYCIIPTARGRVRSKAADEIHLEAERLCLNGFAEIVLVGINLSAYGSDIGLTLADAVEAVCSVEGVKRVRLGSLEPDHISDEMLNRLKSQPKFCPQFHLSLQSGCDETLKRMNRHYDTAFYADLVNRIRSMFTDAAITTDVMVGFAGETEEEFEKSLNFVKQTGFAKTHVFAYSRRKGTVAYKLPNQVANSEKSRRSKLMISAAQNCEEEFLSRQIGKTLPVLFESSKDGYAEGYTPNYSKVTVKSYNPHTGEILKVKITDAKKDCCIGQIVHR